jgi:hypothetical protein
LIGNLALRNESTTIETWARTCWLRSYNAANMIITLSYSAYFDASLNSAQDEMVVAGYLATAEAWSQFEIAWKLALAKYQVPYFHMTEFHTHEKPCYDGPEWDIQSRRISFIQTLTDIIRDWPTASIGGRMKKELFDRYDKEYELSERFNLYSLCGRDCAAQVRKFIRAIPSDAPMAFIFEDGDSGKGKLMAEMKSSRLPAPVFKRGCPDEELDKDDPYHVQLQACDLLAWELRRGESDKEAGKENDQLRKSLLALNHRNKIWIKCEDDDLKGLIASAGIKKRPYLNSCTTI